MPMLCAADLLNMSVERLYEPRSTPFRTSLAALRWALCDSGAESVPLVKRCALILQSYESNATVIDEGTFQAEAQRQLQHHQSPIVSTHQISGDLTHFPCALMVRTSHRCCPGLGTWLRRRSTAPQAWLRVTSGRRAEDPAPEWLTGMPLGSPAHTHGCAHHQVWHRLHHPARENSFADRDPA